MLKVQKSSEGSRSTVMIEPATMEQGHQLGGVEKSMPKIQSNYAQPFMSKTSILTKRHDIELQVQTSKEMRML